MDLRGVKLQSRSIYDSFGQHNNSIRTMISWLTTLSAHPQVVGWSAVLTSVEKGSLRLVTDSVTCSREQNWLEDRHTQLPSVIVIFYYGLFCFFGGRGGCLGMVGSTCVSRALVAHGCFASSCILPAGAETLAPFQYLFLCFHISLPHGWL